MVGTEVNSLWEEFLLFLSSIEGLLAVVEAVCVSVSAVYAARLYRHTTLNSRRSAMTQMLLDRSHDERLIQAEKHVRKLFAENHSSLRTFVDRDNDERSSILIVLNNLEFLSSGVNMGTFDEDVFKRMQYSNVMRSWQMTKDFIETLRATHGNTTYFQDFELLAKRWQKNPLESIRS